MWGGRFSGEPDPAFMRLTSSISFDKRLYPHDIDCSIAWVSELENAGILSPEETAYIVDALNKTREELDAGNFVFLESDEDVHTAIERRVKEIVGEGAGKMRTGRSRNDQVVTDLRLYLKRECDEVAELARSLVLTLARKAESVLGVVIPGHTHLQQAQPVMLSHVLLAFAHMFLRDIDRLAEAKRRADVLPLGSGALAGTSVPVDRERLAESLGFSRVSDNSVDAVSDRDFVLDALHAVSQVMLHLSRFAEQLILWCSQEFGLAVLGDSWSSGSSLMPQKKNPDALELVRAKAGRVIGSMAGLAIVMKGLPLSYNRDLQEDKEPLFDAFDTVKGCLEATAGAFKTIEFDAARAEELASNPFLMATDLAEFLVLKGLEFPKAHATVGKIVAYCVSEGKTPDALSIEELKRFSDLFDENVFQLFDPRRSVEKKVVGGGSTKDCLRQIRLIRERLDAWDEGGPSLA